MLPSLPPDPVLISALEHYAYCPRQCALIHLEQVWDENIYTMRGHAVHERVDEDSSHLLEGVRLERALPLWSVRLGLVGQADLVEFHGPTPYPVEYKSGRQRQGRPETIQLCAQAICLEEMTGEPVHAGALFWHGSRKRVQIELTESMRRDVETITAAVRTMLAGDTLPKPVNDKRCRDCSLRGSCMPEIVADKTRGRKMHKDLFTEKE
ncbi:CRISPR-associated protein Cas4 [Desulfonatronum parangueonense]